MPPPTPLIRLSLAPEITAPDHKMVISDMSSVLWTISSSVQSFATAGTS
jgi:hypothetical protein